MKLDVTQTLKTLQGEDMFDKDANGELVEATLRIALINAVLAPSQKENGVDKVKKYELAKRIYANDEVELTIEEVALCKKAVGDTYPSPLLVGQVTEMLEQ